MIDLREHVALVTGSSRGIGRACALRLAQAGADVIVNYVSRRSAAEDVARQIAGMGRRAAVVRADVSEADDVAAMAEMVAEQFERLDILVSNAATGGFRPILANTHQQLRTAMRTNVEAFFFLLQSFFPLLRDCGSREGAHGPRHAKVIAVSSHGARFALPNYSLVGTTKAALESAVRHAALELGEHYINVNTVVSGLVATDAVRELPGVDELLSWSDRQSLTGGRRLSADDVADVVLLLASPLADMIQGQTIVVDAGTSIGLGVT